MTRPPLIQRPVYLNGAEPADLKPMVVEACKKGASLAGLVGGAAVGAVFAYFVPKLLDQGLSAWRDRTDHGEPIELELDEDEAP